MCGGRLFGFLTARRPVRRRMMTHAHRGTDRQRVPWGPDDQPGTDEGWANDKAAHVEEKRCSAASRHGPGTILDQWRPGSAGSCTCICNPYLQREWCCLRFLPPNRWGKRGGWERATSHTNPSCHWPAANICAWPSLFVSSSLDFFTVYGYHTSTCTYLPYTGSPIPPHTQKYPTSMLVCTQ